MARLPPTRRALLIAAAALVHATGCGGTSSGALAQEFVDAHNAVRARINNPAPNPALPPLTWSTSLGATAQAWADGCSFSHSSGPHGENIRATMIVETPTQAVEGWAAEEADYDYGAGTCSDVTCANYTQIVWRSTTTLGCGTKLCTNAGPFGAGTTWQLVVCNYSPPGNFIGQQPY